MKINQLIQTNADIITVLTVKRGDIYKRLDEPSYGSAKLLFGVVTDVLANGERSTVTALEVTAGYNSVEVTEKVFAGEGDVQLYPAALEDFETYRDTMIAAAQRGRTEALKKYQEAEALYRRVQSIQGLDVTEVDTITVAERKAIELADLQEQQRLERAAEDEAKRAAEAAAAEEELGL